MARVLKAQQFKNTSFLQASIGNNTTYMWRSILAAQDLLKRGCIWRVGMGSDIKVWSDPWLLDDANPCMETIMLAGQEDMRVADFIEGREWN